MEVSTIAAKHFVLLLLHLLHTTILCINMESVKLTNRSIYRIQNKKYLLSYHLISLLHKLFWDQLLGTELSKTKCIFIFKNDKKSELRSILESLCSRPKILAFFKQIFHKTMLTNLYCETISFKQEPLCGLSIIFTLFSVSDKRSLSDNIRHCYFAIP